MEYYWKLRSKNAQNIKALKSPLQQRLQIVRINYKIIKYFPANTHNRLVICN